MYIYKSKFNDKYKYYVNVELDNDDNYIFENTDIIENATKFVKNHIIMCDENYNRISYENELKEIRKQKLEKINGIQN